MKNEELLWLSVTVRQNHLDPSVKDDVLELKKVATIALDIVMAMCKRTFLHWKDIRQRGEQGLGSEQLHMSQPANHLSL